MKKTSLGIGLATIATALALAQPAKAATYNSVQEMTPRCVGSEIEPASTRLLGNWGIEFECVNQYGQRLGAQGSDHEEAGLRWYELDRREPGPYATDMAACLGPECVDHQIGHRDGPAFPYTTDIFADDFETGDYRRWNVIANNVTDVATMPAGCLDNETGTRFPVTRSQPLDGFGREIACSRTGAPAGEEELIVRLYDRPEAQNPSGFEGFTTTPYDPTDPTSPQPLELRLLGDAVTFDNYQNRYENQPDSLPTAGVWVQY